MAKRAQKQIGDAWTIAYEKLISTMTELLKNLEGKLNKDDTRWLAFGLQIPATITTHGQPVNVNAHMDSAFALIVTCDPVPTAARYRFRMMILGVQTEYSLVASSTEPMASIRVLPGQTVQIIVQAVRQSPRCGKRADRVHRFSGAGDHDADRRSYSTSRRPSAGFIRCQQRAPEWEPFAGNELGGCLGSKRS